MYRFLSWRFGGFKNKFKFESAIITHPDKDHYGGFEPLFKAQNIFFGTIFHNGIVERTGKYPLGPRIKIGNAQYHPRPDTLGALGKYGRGQRPLIFSTELARSANENIKHPYLIREKIKELNQKLLEAGTEIERASLQKLLDKEIIKLERSIAVYGMISLRTDGKKVIIAQKLEQQRSRNHKWDIHQFEQGPDNRLHYV